MRVTTAITLAAGAAVGFLFGVGTDADTKERITRAIKGKIFYAMTGEEMTVRNWKPKTPNRTHHYSDIPNPAFNWTELKEHLKFDSRNKAFVFIKNMITIANDYKFVSVTDVYDYFGLYKEFIWSRYGWSLNDIKQWKIREQTDSSGKTSYIVTVSEPKCIY
jgi:hypothetical protein